ncbi:MAG TPA: hypothetical protein VGC07_04285 [Granulicella sp.]
MRIDASVTSPMAMDKDKAQHAKLVDAAQQFEGMLLQEMLKGMQTGKDGDDDSGGEGDNDTMRSYGVEAVAHGIAQAGGIGIAKQVVAKVDREHQSRSGTGLETSH